MEQRQFRHLADLEAVHTHRERHPNLRRIRGGHHDVPRIRPGLALLRRMDAHMEALHVARRDVHLVQERQNRIGIPPQRRLARQAHIAAEIGCRRHAIRLAMPRGRIGEHVSHRRDLHLKRRSSVACGRHANRAQRLAVGRRYRQLRTFVFALRQPNG